MKITVISDSIENTYTVNGERTVLAFLQNHGYVVDAVCGGHGFCMQCTAEINGLMRPTCLTVPEDGMVIRLSSQISANIQVQRELKAACDLGTTTVYAALYDRITGEHIKDISFQNPQKSFGADVISRIDAIQKDYSSLKRMHDLLLEHLRNACAPYGIVKEAVFAGNTIMQHILTLHNPISIAHYPFTAETLFQTENDMHIYKDDMNITVLPCIASYAGGDITAGILSVSLSESKDTSLFIDVGTNGELVLAKDGKLTACSVPAGPAFEGAEISCGSSDPSSAITHYSFYDHPEYSCEVPVPSGVCGSGIIDLLACLLNLGIVDETGRLMDCEEISSSLQDLICEGEEGNSFKVTDHLRFTYKDVRMLQMAIASLSAGISTLLIETGTDVEEIRDVYLSGNFGSHLNIESCIRTGMFPAVWKDRIQFCGNTSLEGVRMILRNPELLKKCTADAVSAEYIELSQSAVFMKQYPEFMILTEDKKWNTTSL